MEALDPKWVDIALKLLNMVGAAIAAVVVWAISRSKASQAAVSQLAKQHREDVARLEKERIKSTLRLEDSRRKSRKEIEERIESREMKLTAHMDQMQSELIERVDTVETDVRKLRDQVHGMPTKRDIIKVHERLNDVAETARNTEGQLTSMAKTLHLIETHLINGGKS